MLMEGSAPRAILMEGVVFLLVADERGRGPRHQTSYLYSWNALMPVLFGFFIYRLEFPGPLFYKKILIYLWLNQGLLLINYY